MSHTLAKRQHPESAATPSTVGTHFHCYARTNCEACFRSFYAFAEPLVRHRVAAVVHDRDDIDDLVARIFGRMIRARAKYDPRRPLLHWLNRIVTNAIRNWLRDLLRERNRSIAFSDLDEEQTATVEAAHRPEDPSRDLQREEIRTLISFALAPLPRTFRFAWELRHEQGMTFPEAAEVANERPGTMKTRAFRACRAIREALGDVLRDALRDEIRATD